MVGGSPGNKDGQLVGYAGRDILDNSSVLIFENRNLPVNTREAEGNQYLG